jgi:hypothetical protein
MHGYDSGKSTQSNAMKWTPSLVHCPKRQVAVDQLDLRFQPLIFFIPAGSSGSMAAKS